MKEDPKLETLSKEEQDILEKFKEAISDVTQPKYCDDHLLRFLVARNMDLKKAEIMIRNHFEWRKKWDIDGILNWEPPEVMVKHNPQGFLGYDKDGDPVMLMGNGHDMVGIMRSCRPEEILKFNFQNYEKLTEMVNEISIRTGRTSKPTAVMDFEGIAVATWLKKDVLNLFTSMSKMFEDNYPEMVKTSIAINVPKAFYVFYNLVKPFLNEKTMSKFKLYNSDRSIWVPELLKLMDASILPKHWGGERVDPDGNPKCPSIIPEIGKIPKYYYLDNNFNKEDMTSDFTEAVVNARSKLKVKKEVSEKDFELSYSFYTEDYDIRFGIKLQTDDGSSYVLPLQRLDSHLELQKGTIPCSELGTYTVVFDNSFSNLRSKVLNYTIDLTPKSGK